MDLALARHGSIWVSRQGTGEPTRLAWTLWTSPLAHQKSDTESSKCNVSFRRYACTSTNNNVERFWQAAKNLDLAEPATPLPPFLPSSLGKGHATATKLLQGPRDTVAGPGYMTMKLSMGQTNPLWWRRPRKSVNLMTILGTPISDKSNDIGLDANFF